MTSVVRCPTCGREVPLDGDKRPATAPFCQPRCRVTDLGAWADGSYQVPGRSLASMALPEDGLGDDDLGGVRGG